ncbi:unnamed protein product, partial [Mesorhabditis belari]|uniref:DUF8206 domain-containing protein n=1 Tax=Mesorhabditis belari TaxID=2138241 RepID=A0AAF3FR04_9BILA
MADDLSATESASFDQTRQFNPSQQPIHSNDPDADVKKKIVLFNLLEPFGDDQMKEQADRNAFHQVLCAINAEGLAENIREIKREGRFEQNGRPRRVIVTFTDENVQRIVVECAPQLSKTRQLKHLALYAYKSPAQRFEPLPKQQTKRQNNKTQPTRADGYHGGTSRKVPDQKFEQRGKKEPRPQRPPRSDSPRLSKNSHAGNLYESTTNPSNGKYVARSEPPRPILPQRSETNIPLHSQPPSSIPLAPKQSNGNPLQRVEISNSKNRHKQHGKPSNVQSNDVNPKYPQRIFHNSFRFGHNGARSGNGQQNGMNGQHLANQQAPFPQQMFNNAFGFAPNFAPPGNPQPVPPMPFNPMMMMQIALFCGMVSRLPSSNDAQDAATPQFPHTSPVPMETDDIELEAPTLPLARKSDTDQRNAVDSLNGRQDVNLIREAQLNAHNINARLQDLSPEQQELYLKTFSKNLWREDKQDDFSKRPLEKAVDDFILLDLSVEIPPIENSQSSDCNSSNDPQSFLNRETTSGPIAADIYKDNNPRKLFGTSQLPLEREFEEQDVVSAVKPLSSFTSSNTSFHGCQTNVQQLVKQFEKAPNTDWPPRLSYDLKSTQIKSPPAFEAPTYEDSQCSENSRYRQISDSNQKSYYPTIETERENGNGSVAELKEYSPMTPIGLGFSAQRGSSELDWQKEELMQAENNVEELRRLATIRVTSMEILPLSMPQTVCRSQKCAKYERIDGKETLIYRVCHKDCKLGDNRKRDGCMVFNYNFCNKCSCHINDHERISYEQRITTKSLENPQKLASEANAAEMKKSSIRKFERLISGFQKESNYILVAMATFSAFLAENGITQKTNLFEQHLQKLIVAEDKKMRSVAGVDADEFNRLLELSVTYGDICKQFVHQRDPAKISLDELQEIRQKLFSLPLNGAMIAQIFDIHVKTDHQDYEATVTRCQKSMFQSMPHLQNSAFLSSDSSDAENEDFEQIANPRPVPVLTALSPPMHQQMFNSSSAISQESDAAPQANDSGRQTMSCQLFPAGIRIAPTSNLPQFQPAPHSNNAGPPNFADNRMPSQFPMVSPQPGFPPAVTPQMPPQVQQMPNGNMMGFMQDPNFMQQMMLFMQQMQLQAQQSMQQNGAFNPNPAFPGYGMQPMQGIQQLPQPPPAYSASQTPAPQKSKPKPQNGKPSSSKNPPKYVEKSIEEEEKCIKAGGDRTKLANLKRCLDEYRQERAAIEHALQSGGNHQQQITTDDVKNMKAILFALPHFGAKLKELFEQTVRGYSMNQQKSVQKFAPPTYTAASSSGGGKKRGLIDKLRRIFPK